MEQSMPLCLPYYANSIVDLHDLDPLFEHVPLLIQLRYYQKLTKTYSKIKDKLDNALLFQHKQVYYLEHDYGTVKVLTITWNAADVEWRTKHFVLVSNENYKKACKRLERWMCRIIYEAPILGTNSYQNIFC